MATLFDPLVLGELKLKNRIVMAPMTRNRADASGLATPEMVDYYAQRAGAGLIVAEGSWPSAEGQAYNRQPGIATPEQVRAWRRVTDAVHEAGGQIVLQIMHAGRIGSRRIKGEGVRTVAPSAIGARGEIHTDAAGMQPFDVPEALTSEEVRQTIAEHGLAAQRAREAGFDGVELHGTSGYLPMSFLCSDTNQRSDEYGGSVENRVRFIVECLQAMAAAIGAGRVGLRLNPGNRYNDTSDADPEASHLALMQAISPLQLAYLHVMRAPVAEIDAFKLARSHFCGGGIILNDGFSGSDADLAVSAGVGDAVSFARHYIANPDLARRLQLGLPLARFDRTTLYTAGSKGYNDYPPLA
ncbi:alkene reductase [Craterilacuibacter sp. RT1T]|uniref:alkene reductase n=1 Tax=Craterilacuibacter sp. RT1T TaxID=2942211 RepID=UPI0020C1470C|nr:alkene reductase [Craterilacuibacter sp. RT1T]MCL6262981.1 alkene reductase [Craterilacuibacter sp. RT1T]